MTAIETWQELVKTKMQVEKLTMQDAASKAAKENPQLLEAVMMELIPEEPATPESDPQAKWNRTYNAIRSVGISGHQAILAIDKRYPSLRSRMLLQANGRLTPARPTAPSVGTSYKSQWDMAVASFRAAGMNSQKALMAANKRHPSLRIKMLDEVNGRLPAVEYEFNDAIAKVVAKASGGMSQADYFKRETLRRRAANT